MMAPPERCFKAASIQLKTLGIIVAVALASSKPSAAFGASDVRRISSISSAAAAMVLEAGLADAGRREASVCIVVLDEAGRFVAGRCMDGVTNSAFDVAYAKARHSANFRRPTRFQEDLLVNQNALQILAVPGMLPLEGGLPIQLGEDWIGAVGVAGAASDIDGQIAAAAISSVISTAK